MPFSALKKAFNMLLDKGCECGDGFKHLFIGYPPVDDSNSNSTTMRRRRKYVFDGRQTCIFEAAIKGYEIRKPPPRRSLLDKLASAIPVLGLVVGYGLMVLAQTRGGAIIGLLWGPAAQTAALTANDDVDPNADLEALCTSYESHHYAPRSNVLHAAGMCLTFKALVDALFFCPSRRSSLLFLAYMPPLWYLYAWAGHFFIQMDIPAVFNYGTTLRGWAAGEFCSVRALVGWGPSGFHTTPEPSHVAATILVMLVHFTTLPPFRPGLLSKAAATASESPRSRRSAPLYPTRGKDKAA
jgi:hypothetical protein